MRQKLVLEYPIQSSPRVLYARLSTPGGLQEWFADSVNLNGNIFTFVWDGAEQKAELAAKKENKFIRFSWIDEDDAWFEFRIVIDELTKDVALVITDNIEEDEFEDATELWNSQIQELKHVIGL
ncbi:MAG: START-like domain-containing protein [Bacteroidales bacterium]|nr:START-like domain-containing protein [Bacteroidales bacterium]